MFEISKIKKANPKKENKIVGHEQTSKQTAAEALKQGQIRTEEETLPE
jgi:hypothetical protein